MDSSGVKKYIQNTYTPGPVLHTKLRALGCDIEWLMTGNKKEELEHLDNTPLFKIPIFEYVKAGGKSMVLREEPAEYLHTTTKDKTLYGVKVKGVSMQPTIMEGEIVVASKTAQVKDADICIVVFEDNETCLRRVYFSDHSCTLQSDNKDFPPQTYKNKDIKTMHKVVERITKF
jgi:SOS-response transcriptional repressor LexA